MAVYEGAAQRAEQKAEALWRMCAVPMEKWLVEAFREKEQIFIEKEEDGRLLFHEVDTELKEMIKQIEKECGYLVYHIREQKLPVFGAVWIMLFICPEKFTWETFRQNLLSAGTTEGYIVPHEKGLIETIGFCGLVSAKREKI